jgi:hypothetical protein
MLIKNSVYAPAVDRLSVDRAGQVRRRPASVRSLQGGVAPGPARVTPTLQGPKVPLQAVTYGSNCRYRHGFASVEQLDRGDDRARQGLDRRGSTLHTHFPRKGEVVYVCLCV